MVKQLIAYERFFSLSTSIGNISQYNSGVILCNLNDGKHPSTQDNNDFKNKTSFEIHCKTKSKTIVWIIILLCSGILLLF